VDKRSSKVRVVSLDTIKKALNELHDTQGMSWRQISSTGLFKGIPAGVLYDIAVRGIEPKSAETRQILGLPSLATVSVCPVHGVVHTRNCPQTATKRPRQPLMSEEEWDARLVWLENVLDGEQEAA
jgi:hypothetical protein